MVRRSLVNPFRSRAKGPQSAYWDRTASRSASALVPMMLSICEDSISTGVERAGSVFNLFLVEH